LLKSNLVQSKKIHGRSIEALVDKYRDYIFMTQMDQTWHGKTNRW